MLLSALGQSFSTAEVAEREGLPQEMIRRLCRQGLIWPAFETPAGWLIHRFYTITRVPRGRPKGAKGKYPKGVKRQRKTPTDQ